MSSNEYGYVTPRPHENNSKNSWIGIAILLGLICLIGLAALGAYSAYKSAKVTTATAEITADEFFTRIKRHDFTAAHKLFSPDAEAVTPESSFETIIETTEKIHGKLQSWGKPQWFVQNYNGAVYVRLTYPLTYSHDTSTVAMVLQQTSEGSFRIRNFDFQL